MKNSMTWTRLLATTMISGASIGLASPAFAQEAPEPTTGGDAAQTQEGDTITVTGSRIARPDLTSTSPVTTVDSEQVALTGTTTLETLINDLPQVIPGNNRTSNNSGGFAFSTIDLRGLGPGRTLILVDGERLPASSSSGVVDIAQVPVGLIQRIDVVTGGATAVYGSDAVAGVVNFVLNRRFEGIELTGQVGIAQEGVGFNYNVSGMFGGNFADGRGNITMYGSYFQREGVSQSRFDYSRISAAVCANAAVDFLTVCDDPSDIPAGGSVFQAGGSATPPWGQVNNNAANPFNIAALAVALPGQFGAGATPAGCAPTGSNLSFNNAGQLTRYFGGGACAIPIRANGSSRYNFAPDNLLSIPYDRLNFSVIGDYEFSDRTRVSMFAAYTNSNSQVALAPTPAAGGTGFVIDPVRVAASCVGAQAACALPADLAAALASRPNPIGTFAFDRRFNETGARLGINESQAFNARVTLEHDLGGTWKISGGAGIGRTDFNSINIGNVNRLAVEQAIYGCRLTPASPVNGPGVLNGCVPINIYGAGTISQAGVNFIQTDTVDTNEFTQTRVSVNLTGTLWDLPGGPVGVAVGAEIRTDDGSSVPDDAKQRGAIIGFNQQQPTAGSITAREVYGEVRLPILGGNGFPDLLAVELGARFSDYSSLNDPLFNWKAGLEFAPVNWVRFRATYNKAARAPSVFELFQNGDQGFAGFTDICNFNRPGGPPAACTTGANGAPVVPLAVAPTFLQNNSQVQVFSFGQAGLSEEEAETYTIGAVIAPQSFPIGRFSATVDYYNITLRGAIQGLGAAFYLNACYLTGDPTACARITRDPATGQISQINTGRRNNPDVGGPVQLSGVDVGLNWVVPLSEVFGGSGESRIRMSNIFSYAIDYKVSGTDFVDIASSGLGGVTSEFSNTFTLAYEDGPLTVQGRWVYKSGGADDTFGLASGPGEDPVGFAARVPDLSYYDLSVRFQVSERFELTAIVNNVLDDYPTQTVGGTFEQANANVSFFSPLILGRSFSIQGRVRF